MAFTPVKKNSELDHSIIFATIIAEAIRDLGEVPSGHLYARVMAHMDIHVYERIINFLVDKQLVRRSNAHLLTWIGPAKEAR